MFFCLFFKSCYDDSEVNKNVNFESWHCQIPVIHTANPPSLFVNMVWSVCTYLYNRSRDERACVATVSYIHSSLSHRWWVQFEEINVLNEWPSSFRFRFTCTCRHHQIWPCSLIKLFHLVFWSTGSSARTGHYYFDLFTHLPWAEDWSYLSCCPACEGENWTKNQMFCTCVWSLFEYQQTSAVT